MTLVKFEKDGQGFFDFDALLQETSQEFVERVEWSLSEIEEYSYSGDLLSVDVDINESFCTVYIYQETLVTVYSYCKSVDTINVLYLSKKELEMMVGVLNGKK